MIELIRRAAKEYCQKKAHLYGHFLDFKPELNTTLKVNLYPSGMLGSVVYIPKWQATEVEYLQVFVKYCDASNAALRLFVGRAFAVERYFYECAAPLLERAASANCDDLLPRYYGAGVSRRHCDATQYALLLEDLEGYRFFGDTDRFTHPHLAMMATGIGHIHAQSVKLALAAGPLPDERLAQDNPTYDNRPELLEMLASKFRAMRPHDDYSSNLARFDQLTRQVLDFGESVRDEAGRGKCRVLCHQQFRRHNVMFLHPGRGDPPECMKIVNWQNVRYASLAVDLVVLLFVEADQQTRADHFEALLDDYYQALTKTCGNPSSISLDDVKQQIKFHLPIAFYDLFHRISRIELFQQNQLLDNESQTPNYQGLVSSLHKAFVQLFNEMFFDTHTLPLLS